MNIIKLEDGALIVPQSLEHEGIIIDGTIEVHPGDEEYEKYLKEYEREQQLGL